VVHVRVTAQHVQFEREVVEGQRLHAEADHLRELEIKDLRERVRQLEVKLAPT
jgi:hypothetical protein